MQEKFLNTLKNISHGEYKRKVVEIPMVGKPFMMSKTDFKLRKNMSMEQKISWMSFLILQNSIEDRGLKLSLNDKNILKDYIYDRYLHEKIEGEILTPENPEEIEIVKTRFDYLIRKYE